MRSPVPPRPPFLIRIHLQPAAPTRGLHGGLWVAALLLQAMLITGSALLGAHLLEGAARRAAADAEQAQAAASRLPPAPQGFDADRPDAVGIAALEAWLTQTDPATPLFERLARLTPEGVALSGYHQDGHGARLEGQSGSGQAMQQLEQRLRAYRVLRRDLVTPTDGSPGQHFTLKLERPLAPLPEQNGDEGTP